MEERLKRDRNRLFFRIILILLAVWLTVSAVFCAVRLNMEKVNIQSKELSNLNQIKQLIIVPRRPDCRHRHRHQTGHCRYDKYRNCFFCMERRSGFHGRSDRLA